MWLDAVSAAPCAHVSATVAGLIQLCRQGYFADAPGDPTVVGTLTGHGLKDPATAMTTATGTEPEAVDATMQAVRAVIGL